MASQIMIMMLAVPTSRTRARIRSDYLWSISAPQTSLPCLLKRLACVLDAADVWAMCSFILSMIPFELSFERRRSSWYCSGGVSMFAYLAIDKTVSQKNVIRILYILGCIPSYTVQLFFRPTHIFVVPIPFYSIVPASVSWGFRYYAHFEILESLHMLSQSSPLSL
jgi:hypothetical protein